MTIKMKERGPWNRVVSAPKRAQRLVPKMTLVAVNRAGEKMSEALKDTITQGRAGGPALSASTKDRKGHGIKLLDSHAFANAIRFEPATLSREGLAGIPPGTNHPSGISMAKLGSMLENGTALMPARPFVAPTEKRMAPTISGIVNKGWERAWKTVY